MVANPDRTESDSRLRGLVIDNGIGAGEWYPDDERVAFDHVTTGPDFRPELLEYDLRVVPNGADHVAMFRIRDQVREFLEAGRTLFCCCGWFLDGIPGNRWIHDNSHPTREVRHFVRHDPHGLLDGVALAFLDRNRHGISGWWACGYIETADPSSVLVVDCA